ncbi:MAG: hypothetical protein ACOY93_05680 [Bacillota bacterium]
MKRIWILAVAFVVMAAVAGGGMTLALFSAQSATADQEFVAGTLAIEAHRDMGDGIPGPMFYIDAAGGGTDPNQYPTGLWAPGDEHHRILQVENIGSLDAKLTHLRASLQSGSMYLADKLDVTVTLDPAGTQVVAMGKLSDFINADQAFLGGPLPALVGDVINLHFFVSFPLDADNSYQGLSTVVTFTVYAEQLSNNP